MREIDGNTYCFGDDARLLYGWISYGGGLYYSGQDGAVCKGETMIDGHTYCFDTVTGLLVTGWCENNGKRQYRLYDGTPASGLLTVDGTEYLFDSEGYPTSGFYTHDGNTVYYTEEGPADGLTVIGEDTYYFKDRIMQTGICAFGDQNMFFDADGKLRYGWIDSEAGKLYSDEKGCLAVGWTEVDGMLYYFSEAEGMYTGWHSIDGTDCFFLPSGALDKSGLTLIDGRTFLLENGVFRTGWQTIDGQKYYFAPTTGMVTGTHNIDGRDWFFLESGELAEGWVEIGGKTYYYADNIRADGEQTIDGVKYYFSGDLGLIRGWESVGDERYYYDSNGFMLTGLQEIDGKKYYFDPDGVMLRDTEYSIFRFDSNGVATQLPASLENLDDYLDYLLSVNTGDDDFARIWYGVRSLITYKYMEVKKFSAEIRCELSVEALNRGTGSCYHFSSLTFCLFEKLGYDVRLVRGYDPFGYDHWWICVRTEPDGQLYYCDPVYSLTAGQTYKMTYDVMTSYGYRLTLPATFDQG